MLHPASRSDELVESNELPFHLPPRGVAASKLRGADPFEGLDLGDQGIADVVHRLRRAARSELPILLHGETGTGKELFARAVHDASPRRTGRFVAVNCASIPEGLIESELFGHRPGAFTGASSRGSKGLVQQAAGGTLFLDEIGDMPVAMQSRLLRVLAEHEVTPVGADTPVRTDFRVISATHRDLRLRASQGLFREDLLFRLRGFAVTLPALRDRADMVALATRLAEVESDVVGRPLTLSACAVDLIRQLPWPGNVRQLKQVIGTAAWLSEGALIGRGDIEQALHGVGGGDAQATDMPLDPPPPADERSCLLSSLKRNRWNVSRTACEYQTARTTIYRRMAKFGIVQPHLVDD